MRCGVAQALGHEARDRGSHLGSRQEHLVVRIEELEEGVAQFWLLDHLRVLEGRCDHLPEPVQPEASQDPRLDVQQPRGLGRQDVPRARRRRELSGRAALHRTAILTDETVSATRRPRSGCRPPVSGPPGASGRRGRGRAARPPPEAHQILHGVAVGDVRHVLVDYGTGVELLRYVVGGSADRLTPLSWARRYGSAPAKAGRKEWWMLMIPLG